VNNTTFTIDGFFTAPIEENDGVDDAAFDDLFNPSFTDGSPAESDQFNDISNFAGLSAEYTYTIQRLDGSGNPVGDELFITAAVGDNVDFGSFEWYLIHEDADGFAETAAGIIGGEYLITAIETNTPSVQYVCLTCGTRIKTIRGEVATEDLEVGDKVLTMDCGYQPIRWIGGRTLNAAELKANPKAKPIRISAGALSMGQPESDLVVSPQHRVLVRSKIAKRMVDHAEILLPANKLLPINGIDAESEAQSVESFHMLFDSHQIVFSNVAPTESLFTGPEALKAVSPAAREEIETLFPAITAPDFLPSAARFIPEKRKQMKVLAQRHHKNRQPLLRERDEERLEYSGREVNALAGGALGVRAG